MIAPTIRILLLLCLFAFEVPAIVPALEREINMVFTNEPITSALNKIQEQTGLVFSYKPSLISEVRPVNCQLRHKTVREALSLLLPGIAYKARENYVILKAKPVEKKPKKTEVSGYVYDKTTEQKLANVTIYDAASMESATTDEYGYFSIKVPVSNQQISVNKENYADTTISLASVPSGSLTSINIAPAPPAADTVRHKKLSDLGQYTNDLFKKFKGYINTRNIKDTISKDFQVSLLPFVGTNHKLSGNVYNKVSVNVLGGYARGVSGFEMGGLFNLDKENVKGVQAAGLFNVVGDTVTGTQLAGLFNLSGRSSKGVQAAGLFNVNLGSHHGLQAAGLLNANARVRGTQLAGLFNICTDSLEGAAVAGLFNVTVHGRKAVQVAGLFNAGGDVGTQVSALFNGAGYVRGMQLGFLNVADSVSGVPVGFLSFVRHGLHQVEISGDEVFFANIAFRTGVPAFHNIFSAGIQPGPNTTWQIGYGVGTSIRLAQKAAIDVDLTAHHVSVNSFYTALSNIFKLYCGVSVNLGKKVVLAGGPTINIYVTDTTDPLFESTYHAVAPYSISDKTSSEGYNLKTWVGGKLAFRFL